MERNRKKKVKERKTVKRSLIKENKRHRESSSSESSIDVVPDDSSDDEESFQVINLLSPEDNVSVNEFVLVKFILERSADIYYVAKIISIKHEEYEVKFLRRKGNSNSFIFPVVEDVSVIERKDLAAILPCCSQKGTARTASVFKFNFNFSSLNVR